MRYTYTCPKDGAFVVDRSMQNVIAYEFCPQCGLPSPRNFHADLAAVPIHYHSQGFHKTDYDKRGDKLERLNREWSKATGESPPPADSTVKRNSSEKQ